MRPLVTEQVNSNTCGLDDLPTHEIVRIINNEDRLVAVAVGNVLGPIAAAIDAIAVRMRTGGRLFYIGTGTSGRLGVVDAAECPPTFGVSPGRVQAILAGGYEACWRAVEVAEDDPEAGASAVIERGLTSQDTAVGITASGRTPFTLGAIRKAGEIGCLTIGIACNPEPELSQYVDISILPVVGPEVIAGSTRLKAATAQKLVLNMLSTGAMLRLGFTYGNLMANLQLKNEKLRHRAVRILQEEFRLTQDETTALLDAAGWDLKAAIVMKQAGVSLPHAQQALAAEDFSIKRALKSLC